MLNFYPDAAFVRNGRGRISFLENGRDVGVRMAYLPCAMIGIRLYVPRALGVAGASLLLTRDGEEKEAAFPLRFCGVEREMELYAVLIDGTTLSECGHLFFCRLLLNSIDGALYAGFGADGHVRFLREAGAAVFPLLFASAPYMPPPALLGGAIYALPIRELSRLGRLFRGDDHDYDGFFSHLVALGVRALWLCPPAAEERDGGRWNPSQLPRALRASAEKNGIRLLFDLLCCSGIQGSRGFVNRANDTSCMPEEVDDRPGFWNIPALPDGERGGSLQAFFCGREGLLAHTREAGGGGFVIRTPDQFGDALLDAIRAELGDGILIGTTTAGPAPIRLGGRRRYCFGGILDGMANDMLRDACLRYLVDGETEVLFQYFTEILAATPPVALCLQAQTLSTYDRGSFFSAVSEALYEQDPMGRGDRAYQLAELGHLIAGTLPGLSLYLAGEENGLPYPPMPGEAVGGQLAFFLRLAQLRRREPVYRDGGFRLLHVSTSLLVFSREREGEALLTVINRTDKRLTIASPDGFSVVFGGRGLKNIFSVRPLGGIVLKVSRWEGESCSLRFSWDNGVEAATVSPALATRVISAIRRRG